MRDETIRAQQKKERHAILAQEALEHSRGSRKPPKYEDFGLTQSRADIAIARGAKRSEVFTKFYIATFACLGLYCAYQLIAPQSALSWLATAFIGLVIGTTVGMLGMFVVVIAQDSFLERYDHDGYLLNQFNTAKSEYAEWKRRTERAFWLVLDPIAFEREVATVFRAQGYVATLTPRTGDKGVDIYLSRGEESVVVQCKTNEKPIGPSVARELVGAMALSGSTRAILVSRSGFTAGVSEVAASANIELLELGGILRMLHDSESPPALKQEPAIDDLPARVIRVGTLAEAVLDWRGPPLSHYQTSGERGPLLTWRYPDAIYVMAQEVRDGIDAYRVKNITSFRPRAR